MEAKAMTPGVDTIQVQKRDLIEAWSLLERVVVSLRKIGSYYSIPQGQTEQTPAQRQQMLEALDDYFTAELWRELSHARRVIGDYLPDEEAEAIADALSFWVPKDAA